ncbi:hypothetical protein SASPL_143241 [Salvia splendens]|uniref:MULE transposase domain-containing protein n=1 Tax=Salvia splendens TaxID=180675 RepID=A0A8X8ZAN1_SALSN|nr:hypothetical protein SASPL_143241 [Salvia splendens]
MFRCFRQMSNVQQTQVDVAQSCELPPKKTLDVMAKESGGIQHLGFTHIDLKNYLRTKRTLEIKQALLYDETIETFEWLLSAFEDAMMGKRPKTILTDQDQAISVALASKWPSTYHRLCVWHIFQDATIHVSSVFSSFKNTFAVGFSRCVYDLEEESEFLEAWNEMIEKYNLQDNQWLTRMLIDDLREKEAAEDFKNAQSSPVMTFPLETLKHAAAIYTHKIFALFSEELRKAFESKIESENQLGSSRIYKVRPLDRANEHIVTYDSIEVSISCSCRKFEFSVKAAESEDSYAYAMECLLKMGNDIDGMVEKGINVTVEESEGIALINDEYWNLTYTAFDPQTTEHRTLYAQKKTILSVEDIISLIGNKCDGVFGQGVLTETTAELAASLSLAAARRIVEGEEFMRGGLTNFGAGLKMYLIYFDLYRSTRLVKFVTAYGDFLKADGEATTYLVNK